MHLQPVPSFLAFLCMLLKSCFSGVEGICSGPCRPLAIIFGQIASQGIYFSPHVARWDRMGYCTFPLISKLNAKRGNTVVREKRQTRGAHFLKPKKEVHFLTLIDSRSQKVGQS